MQRVLTLTEPGKLELLPADEPGPLQEEELLVRVEYSSVQPLDSEMFRGERELRPPCPLGFEGVGTVMASRSPELPEGARVGFVVRRIIEDCGCWRTTTVLSRQRACIVEIPGDVAFQEAAGSLTSVLTAIQCLRHFNRGSMLVVPGACGALGLALLQLAALGGMRAVGLVRGAARAAWITKELGASGAVQAVDTTAAAWLELAAAVCEAGADGTGGADGVIDGVGGELLPLVAGRLLRPYGLVVAAGAAAGRPDGAQLQEALKSRSLRLVEEGVEGALKLADCEARLKEVLGLMAAGKYLPKVWQAIGWRDAESCLQPQPPWSRRASQFTEGRIGRIIMKLD